VSTSWRLDSPRSLFPLYLRRFWNPGHGRSFCSTLSITAVCSALQRSPVPHCRDTRAVVSILIALGQGRGAVFLPGWCCCCCVRIERQKTAPQTRQDACRSFQKLQCPRQTKKKVHGQLPVLRKERLTRSQNYPKRGFGLLPFSCCASRCFFPIAPHVVQVEPGSYDLSQTGSSWRPLVCVRQSTFAKYEPTEAGKLSRESRTSKSRDFFFFSLLSVLPGL
jgi:hypothetical protein